MRHYRKHVRSSPMQARYLDGLAPAPGFTSLVPKGEGGGDPMNLRPLTVLSQVYRIWAGLRMEDAKAWQGSRRAQGTRRRHKCGPG